MFLQNIGSIGTSLAGFAIVGAVLGGVIRSWPNIKNFFNACAGIVIAHAHLEDEETNNAVLRYLLENYKLQYMTNRAFGSRNDAFRSGKYGNIPFEFFGNKTLMFWRGWLPFWFYVHASQKEEKKDSNVIFWGERPKEKVKVSLIFIRNTLDIDKIVRDASRLRNSLYWNNTHAYRRFFIKKIPDAKQTGMYKYSVGSSLQWFQESNYKLLDHKPEDLGRASYTAKKCQKITDSLYFDSKITKLINEVKLWHNMKEWYIERNIPWKRGWCLYGPPGSGKTSLVRAIAEDLDMPLFVYSLGLILNDELEKSWEEMQVHTPCIALFEDFDTVFHGRENVFGKASLMDAINSTSIKKTEEGDSSSVGGLKEGRLSFDCLLNCIDGVDKAGGIFLVITTNHIDKIDPALGIPQKDLGLISTRPGRIDKAIELGYMTNENKIKMAQRIFFDNQQALDIMLENITKEPDKKETPAQFQERCAALALEFLWQQVEENQNQNQNSGEAGILEEVTIGK